MIRKSQIGLIFGYGLIRGSLKTISKPPLRSNLRVRSRKPILEIAYYYCGCPPRSALILNLSEGFEMACSIHYV